MSFFKENSTYNEGGNFPVADDGIYVCRLKEIEKVQGKNFDDPSILEPNFKWVFEAIEEVDDDGSPFRFVKFTKTNYGNEKAGLTIIVDGMMGRHLTSDEYNDIELDDLKARKFRVNVELTQNQSGKDINKILWVKPANTGKKQSGQQPKPKDDEGSDDDKFGDDPFEK